jgi:hypothetical protein
MSDCLGLRAVYRSHEQDLNDVITRIKGMDDAEIGLVMALAADVRNAMPLLKEALLDLHVLTGPDCAMLPIQMSQKFTSYSANNDIRMPPRGWSGCTPPEPHKISR